MGISASLVKDLRDRTGAGMMECKKALTESSGDLDRATTILRERGIAKASSKEGRATAEGVVATYVHPGDKLAVLVEINCETDFVARTDQFKAFARDVAMHVAATNPLCVKREEVDSSVLVKEREIYRQQALNDGKPAQIVDKIVDGRIEKYYGEVVLMEQPYVKDNDKTITELIKEAIAQFGENVQIKRFIRYRLGE
jgi:elongation factor Ts